MLRPSPTVPSRATGADLGMRVLGILALLLILGTAIIPMSLQRALDPWPATLGCWLLIGSQLACVAALLLRRRHPETAWLLLAVLLVSAALISPYRFGIDPPDIWSPGYWAIPMAVLAITSMRQRGYVAYCVTAVLGILAADGVGMAIAHRHLDAVALADHVFVVLPIADVLLFGDAMMRIARARERTADRRSDAQRRRESQEQESQDRREAARMLHDHVLHALNAIAQPREVTPAALAVEEARTAHQAMTHRSPVAAMVPVESLLAGDPALELARGSVVGSSEPVPQVVAQAIAEATHEALNNVVRHARASSCLVVVRRHHQHGVQVSIIDDGRGFEPSGRTPRQRLGLAQSVLQRMDDIGGQARVDSQPGQGTTVQLSWPQESGARQVALREAPNELARRALTRTAWPGLALGIVLTLLMGPHLQRPWPVMATALVALGIGCWGALQLRHRPLGRRDVALLMAAAMVAWVVNVAAVDVPWSIYLLWMAWGSSALVHLVVLAARVRTGIYLVVGWTAVQLAAVVARYDFDMFATRLSSTVLAGAGETATTLLAMAVARRMVAEESAGAQALERTRSATRRLQETSQLDHHWSRRVTGEALPLLAAVASGRLAADDDQVRSTARSMEVALRDELVLGPERTSLIATMNAARTAGWGLVSTLTPEDSEAALAQAEELVGALGQPHADGQRITLSARGRQVFAVVLDAGPEQVAHWRAALAPLGGEVEADPDFTRLVVR